MRDAWMGERGTHVFGRKGGDASFWSPQLLGKNSEGKKKERKRKKRKERKKGKKKEGKKKGRRGEWPAISGRPATAPAAWPATKAGSP